NDPSLDDASDQKPFLERPGAPVFGLDPHGRWRPVQGSDADSCPGPPALNRLEELRARDFGRHLPVTLPEPFDLLPARIRRSHEDSARAVNYLPVERTDGDPLG